MDWAAVPAADRRGFVDYFTRHGDPAVRDRSCRALGAWSSVAALLELAHDPFARVQQSAIFWLSEVPVRSEEVAELAWQLVDSGALSSTTGQEALRAYAKHVGPVAARDPLMHLARHDRRESIRYEAVGILPPLDVVDVADLLAEPPLVSWDFHCAILWNYQSVGLPPPYLGLLREVDHLEVAAAIAPFATS